MLDSVSPFNASSKNKKLMLYSRTLLAKGPLGLVWCAAQSHRKLIKSDYTSTHIRTVVDRIMYPEVPIAMTISGHLLLGVVRIYSNQVEYLLRDCDILLIELQKAFASARVNLSQTARHATLESVTLLNRFQLDAIDMDTDFRESLRDNHQKDPKEITLEDPIPAGQDSYRVVSFDEDERNSPCSQDNSDRRPRPMQQSNCLYTHVRATMRAEDPNPNNHKRLELLSDNNDHQSYQETEIMCGASYENDLFCWQNPNEERLEPDLVLMEIMKQTEANQNEASTLAPDLMPAVSPLSPEQHHQQISVVSEQDFEFFNSDSEYGYASPLLQIRSTPIPGQTLPKQGTSHHYDHKTKLSDRSMKKRISDSSSILRIRKECPRDPLGSWKLNKRKKRDGIFFEPLLTGLGSDLCNAYQNDYIFGKPYLTNLEEESCPRIEELSTPVDVDVMECPYDNKKSAGNNSSPKLMRSPNIGLSSPTRFMPSPTGGHYWSPHFDNESSPSLDLVETTCGGTSDLEASPVTPVSLKVTPMKVLESRPGVEDTFGLDIPELRNSGDGELSFLAEDYNKSSGLVDSTPPCLPKHSGQSEVEPLSARTRAVAQFLKNKSSVTPVVKSQSDVNVSLKTILEGKRRKVCARMVFETLVLKNHGLVDVQQEESFGDVILTVTQKLSNELNST